MNYGRNKKAQKNEPKKNSDSQELEKITPSGGEILIYKMDDGQAKVDIRLVNETLWMTQSDMAQIFQCSTDNISFHLKNIYDEGELNREATTEEFSTVRKEGRRVVRRKMLFYNRIRQV